MVVFSAFRLLTHFGVFPFVLGCTITNHLYAGFRNCPNSDYYILNDPGNLVTIYEHETITDDQLKRLLGPKSVINVSEFFIRGSDIITTLDFQCDFSGGLTIIENKKLVNLKLPSEYGKPLNIPFIKIASNPLLKKEDLEKIRKTVNETKITYLQEAGECSFSGVITHIDELDVCESVRGSLNLEGTVGLPKKNLTDITECIRIIRTQFVNLDFIMGLKEGPQRYHSCSQISDNPNLFIHPYQKRKLHRLFGGEFAIYNNNFNNSIVFVCTPEEALSFDYDCGVVDGDLVLDGTLNQSLHNLENIKVIKGSLTVLLNSSDTNYTFTELVEIGTNSSSYPAISIENSTSMTVLEFPNLIRLYTGGEIVLAIKGLVPKSLEETVKSLVAGRGVECDFENAEIHDFENSICTDIKGDLFLSGMVTVGNTKIKSISGCLKIVGTGLKDWNFLNELNPNKSSECEGKSEIKQNKEMCVMWREFKILQTNFGKEIDYDPVTDTYCHITEFQCNETEFSEPNSVCGFYYADINVSYPGSSPEMHTMMQRIRQVGGLLNVTINEEMDLEFPLLQFVINTHIYGLTFIINANKKLKSLSMPQFRFASSRGPEVMSIIGFNPTKEQAKKWHDAVRTNEYADRLDIGCVFDNRTISSLSDLDYCTWVVGDLLLHDTTGYTNAVLKSVKGCLQIKNVTVGSLDFLDLSEPPSRTCSSIVGETEVSGNADVICPRLSDIKIIRKSGGKRIEFPISDECDLSCLWDEFLEPENKCRRVRTDVHIYEHTNESHFHEFAKRIRVIDGWLKIENTQMKTIEFPELVTIAKPQHLDERAENYVLQITGNNALRTLSLPKLKYLRRHYKTVAYIENNDGFRLTDELVKIIYAAAQGKDVHYKCHDTSEISDFSLFNHCHLFGSDLRIAPNISGELPPAIVVDIDGCLKIENTTLEHLDFIELPDTYNALRCTDSNVIRDNTNLCIDHIREQILRDQFQHSKPLIIENNKPSSECPVVCLSTNITDDCHIVYGNIHLQGNCTPEANANLASVTRIRGSLTISDCSLTSIRSIFPQLQRIFTINELTLNLERITGDFNVEELKNIKIISLRGSTFLKIDIDKKIPYMTVADLKTTFGENKVDVVNAIETPGGYCVFVSPAVSVKNCTKIDGDLILDQVSWEVDPVLKEITGCLIVKKTSLVSYEFLTKLEKTGKCRWRSGETEISENSCIPYSIRRNVAGELQKILEKGENNKGCNECVGGVKNGEKCHVVIGDLKVDGKATEETKKQLNEVRKVYGRVVVKETNMESISFAKLEMIESDSNEPAIEVWGNLKLTKLELPSLKNVTSKGHIVVKITENPKLEKTPKLMDRLKEVIGAECNEDKSSICQFTDLGKAPPVRPSQPDLVGKTVPPQTQAGNGGKGPDEVKETPDEVGAVTCIAINGEIPSKGCEVIEGDLVLLNTCKFNVNMEKVKHIRGTLRISECPFSSIKSIFPQLKKITSQSGTSLTLEKVMGDVDWNELRELKLKSTGPIVLAIDTDKKIPYMTVADLMFTFGETKVDVKNAEETPKDVCVFVSPAVSVKNCKKVDGDLVLDEKTKEADGNLKEITGCLIMKKTVMVNYEFLTKVEKTGKCRWRSGETEITENSCIPYSIRRNVAGELQKTLEKGENNKGCNECVGGVKNGEKCHVVIGDLKVDGKATEETKKQLGEVREVYGRIVVKDTTMESISFAKLEKVETDSKEPAIEISGNKNLTKLELPALKNTTTNGKVKVKISENPKLEKTPTLVDTLKTITGSDCKEAKESVCQFTEPSQSRVAENQKQPDDGAKKDEEGIGAVGIGLIIVGVLVVVVIAAVAGVVAFIMVKKKKSKGGKGKKSKEAKGKGSKGPKGKAGTKKKVSKTPKKPQTDKTEPSKEETLNASKSKENVVASASKENVTGTPKGNNTDPYEAVPKEVPFNPEDPANAVPPGAEPAAAAAPAAAGGDDYFGTNAPAAV